MLKLVENENNPNLLGFCEKDAFGTRIAAYYETYGTGYTFALFYLQEIDLNITAALSLIDGQMTLSCHMDADFMELAEFVQTIGYENILCDSSACAKLCLSPAKTGSIVEYKNSKSIKSDVPLAEGFDLSIIYGILKHSDFNGLPEYLPWLTDVSHRLRRGTAKVIAAEESGKAVACAMVVFKTSSAAILGAVATLPEFRGKGYAGALVTALAEEMKAKKRRVNLLCAEGSIIRFYQNLGFEKIGEWSLI